MNFFINSILYFFINFILNFTLSKTNKGDLKKISKMKGIDILFLLLFHLLGLIPKRENYKPLSPEMRQEVRKMERYSKGD